MSSVSALDPSDDLDATANVLLELSLTRTSELERLRHAGAARGPRHRAARR